jgi:hypothetical protein
MTYLMRVTAFTSTTGTSVPNLLTLYFCRKTDVETMRTNRKDFPDFVKRARLQKGKTVAALRKKQMTMKWKDKSDVLVSTFHDNIKVDVISRKGVIQKPYVVLDYNKNMGTVDRNGQLQSYKLAHEHLKKYCQKMFRYLLHLFCLNAFIIHNRKVGRISRLDFLLTVAENLSSSGGVVEPETKGHTSKSSKPSLLLGCCFPGTVPGTSKKKPTRRCVVCWANGKRKGSAYWCPDCERPYVWYHVFKSKFENIKNHKC